MKQTTTFKPKSTTKQAKSYIRNHMLSHFDAKDYGVRSRLDAMKMDADSASAGYKNIGPYQKGKKLAEAGSFAISYHDQKQMLSRVYGKSNVSKWSDDKAFKTYTHLIGREYDSMLNEKQSKKTKRSI